MLVELPQPVPGHEADRPDALARVLEGNHRAVVHLLLLFEEEVDELLRVGVDDLDDRKLRDEKLEPSEHTSAEVTREKEADHEDQQDRDHEPEDRVDRLVEDRGELFAIDALGIGFPERLPVDGGAHAVAHFPDVELHATVALEDIASRRRIDQEVVDSLVDRGRDVVPHEAVADHQDDDREDRRKERRDPAHEEQTRSGSVRLFRQRGVLQTRESTPE